MGHTPHLYVPAPWGASELALGEQPRHHVEKVLRRVGGDISYTDGAGRIGAGTYVEGRIIRGEESEVARPMPWLTFAVAAPTSANRARMVVEKLAEVGVDRLAWLETQWSQGRPPRPSRAASWAIAALEQSRGAWLLDVAGVVTLPEVAGAGTGVVVAEPDGESFDDALRFSSSGQLTVVVGPEGGFAPAEVPEGTPRLSLGGRVLRIETAAIVASGIVTAQRHHRGAAGKD
jgi:16S rRNA (uracil1498-N3)-methyltransferase